MSKIMTGPQFRDLYQRLGYSQRSIARELDRNRDTIRDMERRPAIDAAIHYAILYLAARKPLADMSRIAADISTLDCMDGG